MHMYSLVDSDINVIELRVLSVYSMNSDLVIFGESRLRNTTL